MESKTSKTTTKKTAKSAKPKKTLAEAVKLVEFKPDDLVAPQFVAVEDYSKFVTKVQDWQNSILNVDVKFKLEDGVELPVSAHDGDIGLDVYAVDVEYDYENDCYVYHTGIKCETPKGYGAFLMLRSSNYKTDYYLANMVGLIDTATYRGEIILKFKRRTSILETMYVDAMSHWLRMPWYKRMFTKYEKIEQKYAEIYQKAIDMEKPYEVGKKIGQLVFVRFPNVISTCVEELSETERGEGGFGFTGE